MESYSCYKVVLSTSTELLGTCPNNPAIYADFIVSKKMLEAGFDQKKIDETLKEELETIPANINPDEKGITIFRRSKNGTLIMSDTMFRGYLKAAASSLDAIWGVDGKIDRFIYIGKMNGSVFQPDRYIPLYRDGQPITQPDGNFERPLRAQTAQGQRISLASSEMVAPVVTLAFNVTVLPLAATGRGVGTKEKPCLVNLETLQRWFSFGQFSGMGQYRNGSFGRFSAEITEL